MPDPKITIEPPSPLPEPIEAGVQSIESMARLMDSQFAIPGIPYRLGLDTAIGLVPGIGDTIGLGVSGYIVARSAALGARKRTLARMGVNIGIDWLIGLVPLIGDLFDWGWKANNKNAVLLRESLERKYRKQAKLDHTS